VVPKEKANGFGMQGFVTEGEREVKYTTTEQDAAFYRAIGKLKPPIEDTAILYHPTTSYDDFHHDLRPYNTWQRR
jgi:hypothetical protein